MLRSFYLSLLEIIESHTLSVQPVGEQPLPEYIESRYDLHAALVEAIAEREEARALELIGQHNTTGQAVAEATDLPGALSPGR
jgi:DNA-binding FadR family transcriptional regulator